ncbi:MAG: hypothetical protein Q4G35_11985 [Propionibacteriaceae bacterium]|nr:hypothetical protein [Propionibacteriaceae bacterium]
MPMTRRAALAALTLGLTGCAGSPVIVGDPATAPVPTAPPPPPEPTRSAAAEGAHLAVAQVRALLEALQLSPQWEATEWTTAALAQTDAHLARLALADPLSWTDLEPVFEVQPEAAYPPSDAIVAVNRLSEKLARAVNALEAAAADAASADLRLFYASMSTAVLALNDQSVLPVEGDASPRMLQPTTLEASLPVLLGHMWALIYGLGVGMGKLPKDDPLLAIGRSRLSQAQELRNQLRDQLGTNAPEQPAAFELSTAMDSPSAIREAWGLLEVQLMNSYARLVAADADPRWRDAMRSQVPPVEAMGTALTWWPGWLA